MTDPPFDLESPLEAVLRKARDPTYGGPRGASTRRRKNPIAWSQSPDAIRNAGGSCRRRAGAKRAPSSIRWAGVWTGLIKPSAGYPETAKANFAVYLPSSPAENLPTPE
jgi:hypothetical protein